MASMSCKVYIVILMAFLPVILGQSPTPSPAESPKSGPAENRVMDANELLKNAGGDHRKALIANLQAMLVKINQTVTAIDKALPTLSNKNVSSCVSYARQQYTYVTNEIVDGIEMVKGIKFEDDSQEWNIKASAISGEFIDIKETFDQGATFNPFYDENDVLHKMASVNFALGDGIPTTKEGDEECKELLKKAGGDHRKALIANLQAMLVKINETITAIDKTLPTIADKNVSSRVTRAKDIYINRATKKIESGIKMVNTNVGGEEWEDYVSDLEDQFLEAEGLFTGSATINPFDNENEVLCKMALLNSNLGKGIWPTSK